LNQEKEMRTVKRYTAAELKQLRAARGKLASDIERAKSKAEVEVELLAEEDIAENFTADDEK
jgi:hypothetical protein